MFKTDPLKIWLNEVEAMEERLEGMKISAFSSFSKRKIQGIVEATAGLLKGRVRSGVDFQRHLRRGWSNSFSRRTT